MQEDLRSQSRAVAVTGLGAVSACGWGVEALWRGLTSGHTAVAQPRTFDTTGQRTCLAAEAPPPPVGWPGPLRDAERWSEAERFAIFAAQEALKQAALASSVGVPSERRIGVFFGGSTAGMAEAEAFYGHLVHANRSAARLNLLAGHQISSPGDAVAREVGATGPVLTLSSACASGALALAAALDALRDGEVDVAIAGGSDSLCRLTYAGFNSLRAVDAKPCRPFRQDRQGLSLGEGAGVVVLERGACARARGAEILGWLLGAGSSCDAHHMTAPHPEGLGAARAIRGALDDAGVEPQSMGFVNAHGTGTPHNDIAEWRALGSVFEDHATALPVTSTKGVIGHLLGSSGAIEAVATVLCLQHGMIHPTPGEGTVDEQMEVDLVTGNPRPLAGRQRALSTSFAFGGSNAALVLADHEGVAERQTEADRRGALA